MNAIIAALLPFIIIIFVFRFISQRINFLRGSLVKKLLFGYVAVLLALSVVYYVMPKKETIVYADNMYDREQFDQEADRLYTALSNGDVENIDKKYVKKTWDFSYEQGEINMIQPSDRANIFVERTDQLDHEIEVTFYQSPLIYMGIDLNEKVKLPDVELVVDSLVINDPEQERIQIAAFMSSFVEGQFTERESWMDHYPIFRTEVLYVRIPKELKVLGDDGNIYFVPEKRS